MVKEGVNKMKNYTKIIEDKIKSIEEIYNRTENNIKFYQSKKK